MIMSTLRALGGGRVDERKDYGRTFTSSRLNCGIQRSRSPQRRNKIYFLSRPEICFFKYVLFCQWIQLRTFSKHLLFPTNNKLPLCRYQLRKRFYRCNILWQNNDHRPFTREKIGLCSSVLLNRNEVIA